MAIFAITAEYVSLTGPGQLDAYVKSAQLAIDVAQLDTTNMDSAGWNEIIGGLKSFTLALGLMDDVAASAVDDDLWAVLGTKIAFAIRPVDAAISTSNPEYQGTVLINHWEMGGGVGELAMKTLTLPGSGAIVRDVTP